jgi:peptidoglycan biosynthesis protein MviN/MurJ (putative lipid II flippase)
MVAGAYFVLMVFYLYVLRTRGAGKQRRLAGATMTLFTLCTVHFALVLATAVLATKVYIVEPLPDLTISSVIGRLTVASNAVYVTTKCVARLETDLMDERSTPQHDRRYHLCLSSKPAGTLREVNPDLPFP